jgi:hypothetical protein
MEPLRADPALEEFENEQPPDEAEHDPMALLAGETAFRNPAARHEDPDNLGDRTQGGQQSVLLQSIGLFD